MAFHTVAVVGASGNIGTPLVQLLHRANFAISAITRTDSKSTFPDYVKVIQVDYSSIPSLTEALKGQDVVVSAVGSFALHVEHNLVEAAAAAGVKRFLPAEYGADTLNPKTRAFPILKQKIEVQEQLARKFEQKGMTFTLLFTGLFFDWGLEGGMIVDVKGGNATLYDSGDSVVSFTRTTTVAKAITTILSKPEETENKGIYIQDIATTQNAIIEFAKEVDTLKEWNIKYKDTTEMEAQAAEEAKKDDPDFMIMAGSVFRMYFGGVQYGMPFQKLDNELLGLREMKTDEVKSLIKEIMTKGN